MKDEILKQIKEISSSDALKELENKYFSRKGAFTQVLRSLKDVAADERKEIGHLANQIKTELIGELNQLKDKFMDGDDGESVDISLPGEKNLKDLSPYYFD